MRSDPICKALGWERMHDGAYRIEDSDRRYPAARTPWTLDAKNRQKLASVPLEAIPLRLACGWSVDEDDDSLGFAYRTGFRRDVVVPYLSKRMELEEL